MPNLKIQNIPLKIPFYSVRDPNAYSSRHWIILCHIQPVTTHVTHRNIIAQHCHVLLVSILNFLLPHSKYEFECTEINQINQSNQINLINQNNPLLTELEAVMASFCVMLDYWTSSEVQTISKSAGLLITFYHQKQFTIIGRVL